MTSAGNQGRGKDISTIIEAAEEEKLKAEREAIEQVFYFILGYSSRRLRGACYLTFIHPPLVYHIYLC